MPLVHAPFGLQQFLLAGISSSAALRSHTPFDQFAPTLGIRMFHTDYHHTTESITRCLVIMKLDDTKNKTLAVSDRLN